MTDIEKELKNLNDNATLLLTKYDGVFSKLSEESQKILLSMKTQGQAVLDDISEMLASGNVAQAENALKLGGKTIEELKATFPGKLISAKALFNNTRYSGVSGKAGQKLDFGYFTKVRDDTTLMMHLTCSYGATVDSDSVSVYLRFNGKQTEQGYTYVDSENTEGMSVLAMNTFLRDVPAGTDKVTYGYPRDIGNGIGTVLNPNSSDDKRLSQTASVCIVYEVLEG